MTGLLCILLYLSAIFSPSAYFQAEIDEQEIIHENEIFVIEQDEQLNNFIVNEFTIQANMIHIYDPNVGD